MPRSRDILCCAACKTAKTARRVRPLLCVIHELARFLDKLWDVYYYYYYCHMEVYIWEGVFVLRLLFLSVLYIHPHALYYSNRIMTQPSHSRVSQPAKICRREEDPLVKPYDEHIPDAASTHNRHSGPRQTWTSAQPPADDRSLSGPTRCQRPTSRSRTAGSVRLGRACAVLSGVSYSAYRAWAQARWDTLPAHVRRLGCGLMREPASGDAIYCVESEKNAMFLL